MQPTLPQATGTADMDLTAVQSMDWFFKKEQMYLLAQFWQQRATLAEKEVNTLKEQLSTNHPTSDDDVDEHNNLAIAAALNNISNTNNTPTIDISCSNTKKNNTTISTNKCNNNEINTNTTNINNIVTTAVTAAITPPNSKLLLLSPTTPTTTTTAATTAVGAFNNNNQFNNNNTKLLNSVAAAITLHQNGGNSNLLAVAPTTTPSPSPPLSDSGSNNNLNITATNTILNSQLHTLNGVNGCINPKLFFNHAQQMMMEAAAAAAAAAATVQQQHQQQQQISPMQSPQLTQSNKQQQQQNTATANAATNNIDDDENEGGSNDGGERGGGSEGGIGGGNCSDGVDSKTITTMTAKMNINNDKNNENENENIDNDEDDDDDVAVADATATTAAAEATEIGGDKVERTDDNSIKLSNNNNKNNKKNNNNNNNNNSCSQNSKNHHKRNCTTSSKSKRNCTQQQKQQQRNENSNNKSETSNEQRSSITGLSLDSSDDVQSDNHNNDDDNDNDDDEAEADNDNVKRRVSADVDHVDDDDNQHNDDADDEANTSARSEHRNIDKIFNNNNHADLLAAKDKEIKALIDEVQRLRALEQTHIVQIHRLEDHLEAKRQHIIRLEAHLDKTQINAALAVADSVANNKDNISKRQQTHSQIIDADNDDDDVVADDAVHHDIDDLTAASNDITKDNMEIDDDDDDEEDNVNDVNENESHLKLTETTNLADYNKIKRDNQSQLDLEALSQQSAIAAAAVAAAACGNDPNKFQELLLERTKALAAAEALKNSEDAMQQQQQQQQQQQHSHHYHSHHHAAAAAVLHQQHQLSLAAAERAEHDKSAASGGLLHHDSSSSASTPNLHDQRSNDELNQHHIQPHQQTGNSLNGSKSLEDNNNSLCATPINPGAGVGMPTHHLPPGFLPGLPFQFQERGPYRFATDDLQLPPGASMAGRLGESLIPKGDPMEAKLQEMLRYNMDKYANQALDTLHISRRVRELLSVHNIGQRLFAKYILGLSQGTVSELLSKPKPWDKLTEKGRDSYRKMHAWGCDDNAVMLLKSLIPKKDSGLPPYGGRGDDSMPDDRITHLLNEASSLIKNSTPNALQQIKDEHQRQMQQQDQQQQQQHARRSVHDESMHSHEDSKSPSHQPCTSPFYKDSLKSGMDATQSPQHQPHQRLRPDAAAAVEMTSEKVARIYQEFMSRAPREAAFPSFLFSPFFSAAAAGGMPPGLAAAGNAFPAAAMAAADAESMRLAATGLPNFPNFSSLMAHFQLNGAAAQDLTLTKEALKIEHKINGQRGSFEHSNSSMDSQSLGRAQTPSQAKDLNVSAHENERHSSGGGVVSVGGAFSMHGPRKSDTPAPPPPPPPPTSNNSGPVNTTSSAAPSPLSNSILPPAMTPGEDFSAAASPLQRMASITNSLITQPPVTPHHSQPQRPTKAVLPPITQQQFDMFNNLNTEDIVRRVKEALSQYSISQRLFGESVLGLSQGSVSDLLARPKPWHMLTQKGREPFIRMKMFLEDENAVHKLVASQYKIAPEKLMRTGSYSGTPQIPQGLANKMQAAALPMQKMMNELKLQEPGQAQHIMQQMQAAAMSAALQQQHQQQQSQQAAAAVQAAQAAAAAQHHQNMLLTSPGLPPQHAISLPAAAAAAAAVAVASNPVDKKPMMMPIHSPHQANAMRNMHQHMSPTVYEMAALTQDLDTQVITTKIKEALLSNNIGQKIFGEAVLGLSQGSVSELLSKPKPWHMLSIKGREPFIRMQLWLSDANNVERLQLLKNERREASKRRRSTGHNQQDNSSDTSSNDTNDFYTSSPGPGSVGSSVSGAPPNKKQRVLFSEEQKEALRLAFTLDPYPNVGTIEFLANELGLATRTITNWFHNHRMRLKQQVPHGQPGAENAIPSRENTNSTPFDPMQFRILLQQRLFELHKERMGLAGAPIHYPPNYFAALLGRSLANLPGAAAGAGGEPDLQALNQAFREQMKGLDLTMGALKPERGDDFDDDESHMSDNESMDGGDDKSTDGFKETPRSSLAGGGYLGGNARSSRRKAAAPQWLNPANLTSLTAATAADLQNERIINGVCVLQAEGGDDENAPNASGTESGRTEKEANDDSAATAAVGAGAAVATTNDDTQDLDQRILEPEVRIKQENEDNNSDSETPINIESKEEQRIKVVGEEKLRMVRVSSRLSNDENAPAATGALASAQQSATTWNY